MKTILISLAAAAAACLFRFKLGVVPVLGIAAASGLLLRLAGIG